MEHKYRHVMFDCETLSLRPRAVVLSLGAVAFDPERGVHPRPFYAVLNKTEQVALGREIDAATVAWWNNMDTEAADVLKQAEVGANLLSVARLLFGWLSEKAENGWCAWANGAEFDLPLITDLLADVSVRPPWHYRNARCMRTMKEELPEAYERALARHEQGRGEPVHHAALDALWQATVMRDVLREAHAMRALTEALMTGERIEDASKAMILAREGLPR